MIYFAILFLFVAGFRLLFQKLGLNDRFEPLILKLKNAVSVIRSFAVLATIPTVVESLMSSVEEKTKVSANDSSTIVTIPLDVIQALEIVICFYVVLEAIEIVIVCGHNAKLIAKKCFRRLPGSLFAAGCYVMLNLQLYHFTQLWFAGSPGLYDKLSTKDWQNIHYFGVVAVVFYNFLFISNENINWRALELEEDPVAQQKKTDSVAQDDKKRSSSESSLSFKTHKVPYRIALPDRFTPVLIWFVERSATFLETELPSGSLWLSDPVNIITPLCGFIGVVSSFLLMLFPGALWTFDSHSHLIFHAILIAIAQGTLMLA